MLATTSMALIPEEVGGGVGDEAVGRGSRSRPSSPAAGRAKRLSAFLVAGHFLGVCAFLIFPSATAATLSPEEALGRSRMALQVARERNDRELVAAVEKLGRAFQAGLPADADRQLRELEARVGLDPGGWSMAGQPLFHPTPAIEAKSKDLAVRLAAAMKTDDPAQVRRVTAEMRAVLGPQAGVPDGRRPGRKVPPNPLAEAPATQLFLHALNSESSRVRSLAAGKPLPDQMLRVYAALLDAATTIHPAAARHQPDALRDLEELSQGLAAILIRLQQPAGHFPFPDLRGKNIRFGDLTEKQLRAGTVEVRDGWLVSPDPDGGSQFDTGVAGTALLAAGQRYQNAAWQQAGLSAADWALGQPCCANFNYNAFSVSLLARAYRVTGDAKYLAGALGKFRVGVAPGQAPNGRWLDAHNARTVYHVIILRALGDLAAALPPGPGTERSEVELVTRPALTALLDEFDAMGITVEALPELLTLRGVFPDNTRLRGAVELMAASLIAKSTDGQRIKMGAQPNQLAAVALVWP